MTHAVLFFGRGDANELRCFTFMTEEPIIFMSSECVMFELPSSLRVPNTRGHVNVLRALPEIEKKKNNNSVLSQNLLTPSHPVRSSQPVSEEITIIKN